MMLGIVLSHTEDTHLGGMVMVTVHFMIHGILHGDIADGTLLSIVAGTIHGITEDMDMVVTMEAITVVVTDMDIVVVSVMDTTQDLLIIGQVEVQVFTDHLQVEDPAMLLVLQDEQVLHQAV